MVQIGERNQPYWIACYNYFILRDEFFARSVRRGLGKSDWLYQCTGTCWTLKEFFRISRTVSFELRSISMSTTFSCLTCQVWYTNWGAMIPLTVRNLLWNPRKVLSLSTFENSKVRGRNNPFYSVYNSTFIRTWISLVCKEFLSIRNTSCNIPKWWIAMEVFWKELELTFVWRPRFWRALARFAWYASSSC